LWANISIYVISYIYEFDPTIKIDAVFFVDFALLIVNVMGYNLGMYLLNYRKWNVKTIIFVGGTVSLIGKFLSSYTANVYLFVALYGLLGIGNGLTYMMPLVCCWEYFPERKGLITGIIVGSYGLGSFIFNLLSYKLVNPNNEAATIVIDADTHYFEFKVA
jgi:MFS family permease